MSPGACVSPAECPANHRRLTPVSTGAKTNVDRLTGRPDNRSVQRHNRHNRPPGLGARALATTVALLAVLLVAACREQVQPAGGFQPLPRVEAGEPRTYRLGFSSMPAQLTDQAYLDAFDLAANFGDTLLIQRAPSWADFLPGSKPSESLERRTIGERDAIRERGLQLLFALDPFDPTERGRLATLPPGFEGADLSDPALRQAFVAEAKFIALNYRPAYFALGTEVNAAFEHDPGGYAAFVDAYAEAYDVVKEASPETLVFVTFQYEQLLGLILWEPPHAPRWELFDDFDGRLDLLALTTYPSFVYAVARKVPPLYYVQVREHSPLPIAFASVGYASAPGREGLNSSTAAEQRRFLQRLLRDADELRSPLVVWFAGRDPAFAQAPPLDLLASIGLRSAGDEPKEAWPTWVETANRPYDPEAVEATEGGP